MHVKYILGGLYTLFVVLANYTANIILSFGGISTSAGTLFFGFIFSLRDVLHVKYGKRFVITVIAITVIINFIACLFGGFPFRILFASMVAFLMSELVDTEVYHRNAHKTWALRVMRSNAVAIPLDTFLFLMIAFFGVWPMYVIVSVFIGDVLVKYCISSIIILFRRT